MAASRLNPTLEVERRSRLSFREFDERFLRPRVPVVITDAINAWPAMRRWTPAHFKAQYGDRMVRCRGESAPVPLGTYIDRLPESTDAAPVPYLRNLDLKGDWAHLCREIQPRLPYASPDWLSSRLLPPDWPRPRHLHQLFISGTGTTIPLHYDDWMTHNFVSNLHGEKEFTLFPPEAGSALYPVEGERLISQVDVHRLDAARFPDVLRAPCARVVIGKGDSLFVPAGWWHTTRTVSACISVSSSFANWSNWPLFVDEIVLERKLRGSRFPLAAIRAYLTAVGAALGAARRTGLAGA